MRTKLIIIAILAVCIAAGCQPDPDVRVIPASPIVPAVPAAPAAPSPVAPSVPQPDPTKVYAFCGVDPSWPSASVMVATMAASGITATMGECQDPGPGYSPANTGSRYADPAEYRALVELNASAGLKTIVYDERLWDPARQSEALSFWQSSIEAGHIEAWDMGDEFDPAGAEWPILVQRWKLASGADQRVKPYTNHLWWAIDRAVTDLGSAMVSFDRYDQDQGVSVARAAAPKVQRLMCAVNFLTHGPFLPTSDSVRADIAKLRSAGCTDWLVFGGVVPSIEGFGSASLVDALGSPTDLALALRATLSV